MYGMLVAMTLFTGVARAQAGSTGPRALPAAHQAVGAASADRDTGSSGLMLTGEMLFGGVLLMAGSAYALRRSRR
jgi:hypothetical protein